MNVHQTSPSKLILQVLKIFIISSILPIMGFVYVRFTEIPLLNFAILPQRYSLELVIITIAIFLFSYTCILANATQRFKNYLQEIRTCVDYTDKDFQIFQRETMKRILNPPDILLLPWIVSIPFGVIEVISSPIYVGDSVTTILICSILAFSGWLNWHGSWMLYVFLSTSNKFGKDVPLKINPFDPDRIGGLAPLAGLSTFAIFAVGILATIAIPLWFIFSQEMTILWVFLTSILIPCYFFCSMSGVYNKLKKEREGSLRELNDEIQQITTSIRNFFKVNHKEKKPEEKTIITLGQTLDSINIIHERVKSMHIFPINSEILLKISLSAILPILGILADFLAVAILNII